jgi:phosphate transport system substrate-binding protein
MTLLKTCLMAATVAVLALAAPAHAAEKITGTGASFPAPLYAKWVDAYNKANPNVAVEYISTGSGAGISGITNRTVLFGASDAPLTDAQEKAAPGKLLHIPTVAGPEVMIYNLKDVPKLTLNGPLVADIYLKNVRTWNDPKIAALNPGVALPNKPIIVVHRSDGSGTTYIFTDYLSKVSKKWADDIGKGTTVDWPVGIAGNKNDGVAQAVASTEGSIGYVESAFAKSKNLTYAQQVNKAGKVVPPTPAAIEAATKALAANFPADLKVSITDAPGDDSYPICGFTYILVYEDLSYLKEKPKAEAIVNFIKWCVTDGQKMAAAQDYAPLPAEVQEKVLVKLKAIKFNGETLLK